MTSELILYLEKSSGFLSLNTGQRNTYDDRNDFNVQSDSVWDNREYKERSKMKALFLAGGIGTRLRPLTNDIPKPMVPIMNRPLLEWSMENLRKCGITEIVISTGYKSGCIEDYFGDGSKLGFKIKYIQEESPQGTGGAIKNTGFLYDETFLVFNADIIFNMDLKKLIEFHKSKNASATIAVTRVSNPSAYGVIECDKNGYIHSFTEKPEKNEGNSDFINAGVYVFEPEVLDEIPEERPVSVERDVFPLLIQKDYKVAAYDGCTYWMDIGTPEKYLQTHRDILAGDCCLPGVRFDKHSRKTDNRTMIDSTAVIHESVYIGNNVKIGANTVMGPNTVIGDNVCIRKSSNISNSIIWNNVNIESGSNIEGNIMAQSFLVKCKSPF